MVIIIGIQPLGCSGQSPELSQSTGMALVRCIMGKFLGVVCHCFPPRLDVPTFATRCLNDARDPSASPRLTLINSTFCPHSVFMFFRVDLRKNSDYFPTENFYNQEGVCLLRGTKRI